LKHGCTAVKGLILQWEVWQMRAFPKYFPSGGLKGKMKMCKSGGGQVRKNQDKNPRVGKTWKKTCSEKCSQI